MVFWILFVPLLFAGVNPETEATINDYFLSCQDILQFLETSYSVSLSFHQLYQILRKQNFFRTYWKNNITEVTQARLSEKQYNWSYTSKFTKSSKSFVYRLLHQKLRADGFIVDRGTTRILLKLVGADEVGLRSCHHLGRRTYFFVRPNCLWHIDGYDKIKSYGFAAHGVIGGFIRKIIWLIATSSNNNSKVITSYYLNCVKHNLG